MEQNQLSNVLTLLRAAPDLDHLAKEWSKLLSGPVLDVTFAEALSITPLEGSSDLLIKCHGISCIAKYVQVVKRGERPTLRGQIRLHKLIAADQLGDLLWTLEFSRNGELTEELGEIDNINVFDHFKKQARAEYLVHIVEAIQKSLDDVIEK